MKAILLKCTECDETNEILCDGDNAMMCPDCQSVDSFTETCGGEAGAPCGDETCQECCPHGEKWQGHCCDCGKALVAA